uniref:Thyrotropin-releasing hormone-degrading ectoenzyme n=1 Tax=Sipha flava TaxID=143950 RepID=A0A2S2QZ70_9HEMI
MLAVDTVLWWSVATVALARGWHAPLPGDTVPESYELSVAPDMSAENASFAGLVNIAIVAKKTTPSITLHSKRLVVHQVDVTDVMTNRRLRVDGWTYDRAGERLTVSVGEHVLADRKYTMRLRFEGSLSDGATGFFKSYYDATRSNTKKWFAATQFYATHARSAFPCYDEPAYKTYFKISIRRKTNEIALSNMPILNTVDVVEKAAGDSLVYQNWTWVHFMQTPPISTSSVAFFVGDFERLACTDCHDVTNVYSHLGNLYQIEYITRAAPDLLNTLETYINVTYSLPKLDLLAIPRLSTSVMEGWGLSAYREQSVFVDKNTKSKDVVLAKMTAERVMAHQWFGNLVTPEWWDYTWLNEGFATYFEYFATAEVEPDWRLEHFFVIEQLQSVLEYDQSTAKQHPLSAPLSVPEDDDYDVFDGIARNKGAAVLRMLRDWVGEESFKKAVNVYLTTNR